MAIYLNPLPPVRTKVDGMFEGGGTLGTAYVGVLKALQDHGIWFDRVAGTSAGAINACLIAAGYTADEIDFLSSPSDPNRPRPRSLSGNLQRIQYHTLLGDKAKDANDILNRRSTVLYQILRGVDVSALYKFDVDVPPVDRYLTTAVNSLYGAIMAFPGANLVAPLAAGLRNTLQTGINAAFAGFPRTIPVPVPGLAQLTQLQTTFANAALDQLLNASQDLRTIVHLICNGGMVKGDIFLNTIDNLLKEKCPQAQGRVKFSDLAARPHPIPLVVIAANATKKKMEIYSSHTHPNMSVAEAVRRSMAVPFYFAPRREPATPMGDVLVDGGIMANFPWWVFLDPPPPSVNPPRSPRVPVNLRRLPPGWKGMNRTQAEFDRPKLAFWLDESNDSAQLLNTPLPAGPFAAMSEEVALLKCLLDSQVLLGDLSRIGGAAIGGASGLLAGLDASSAPSADQPLLNAMSLSEASFVGYLLRILGIMNNAQTEEAQHGIKAAAATHPAFYHQAIPAKGFCWLDFFVNSRLDNFSRLAGRGWQAAEKLIRDRGLIPASTAAQANPYGPAM